MLANLRDYFRPSSAEEALKIKRELGHRAAYLAGGSDLMVHWPERLEAMIDTRHAGLGYVRDADGKHVIGGAALLRDVEDGLAGLAGGMLRDAVRNTAPWLIRNAATLAGNVANASPAADSVPALLALDATLVLLGDGEEEVSIEQVLEGPHRTRLGDRLIREIRITHEAGARRAAFIKLARSKSDIAQVNVAVAFAADRQRLRDVRIALGAVAPTAMRERTAEATLEGKVPDEELLSEVRRLVESEVSPISDWRASEEYRRRMSGVLVVRAVQRALREAGMGAEA